MDARKLAARVSLLLLAIGFARYVQVEVADKHSSPFTAAYEFDFRQLIVGPPKGR